MRSVDILAFGAHPDDVELGCGGSISLSKSQGKSIAIIDLTQGELSTRGTVETRKKESQEAAKILGVNHRENMNFRDGFFQNDESHQLELIKKIRLYRPEIVLLINGLNGFEFKSFHSFSPIPYKKSFGLNEGEECIAIISPV